MTILPQLERDLHEAAGERLAADSEGAADGQQGSTRRRRWARRPRPTALATLAGVAVALAVAVVAIALPGHRPGGTHPAAPAATASRELHQLVASFAVLRRPQTAADRAWEPVWEGTGKAPVEVLPQFTRRAIDIAGWHVFLTVGRIVSPRLGLPVGYYLLNGWVVRPGASGPYPFDAEGYTGHGPILAGPRGLRYSRLPASVRHGGQDTLWLSVVPDPITVIGWGFPARSVLVGVDHNVAAFLVPEPPTVSPQQVLWYARGKLVYRNTNAATQVRRVLYGDGIAGARFGESAAEVESAVDPLLGRSSGPSSANGPCGVAAMIYWQALVAFFEHGRFVGYSYGTQGGATTSSPTLATGQGLTTGVTVAHAGRIYGRAFHTSEEQGGTWFLHTPNGTLDGFTYSRVLPRHGDIGPQSRIATIQAGPRLCAALSP